MPDIVSKDIKKAKAEYQRKQKQKQQFTKQSKNLQKKITKLEKKLDPETMRNLLTISQKIIQKQTHKIGNSLWTIGNELNKIKSQKLYSVENYTSFVKFCKMRFGFSGVYAYNAIMISQCLTIEQAERYGYSLCVAVLRENDKTIRDKVLKLIENDVERKVVRNNLKELKEEKEVQSVQTVQKLTPQPTKPVKPKPVFTEPTMDEVVRTPGLTINKYTTTNLTVDITDTIKINGANVRFVLKDNKLKIIVGGRQ